MACQAWPSREPSYLPRRGNVLAHTLQLRLARLSQVRPIVAAVVAHQAHAGMHLDSAGPGRGTDPLRYTAVAAAVAAWVRCGAVLSRACLQPPSPPPSLHGMHGPCYVACMAPPTWHACSIKSLAALCPCGSSNQSVFGEPPFSSGVVGLWGRGGGGYGDSSVSCSAPPCSSYGTHLACPWGFHRLHRAASWPER